MSPSADMVGQYDFRLVAISVFISVLAAYAALDLAERITTSRGPTRAAWLYGGATAMGIGIWAMHYVGMLAFQLPVPVMYDWPTVLLSLAVAVLASGVALYIVSRSTMGRARTIAGSIMMGCGIAGMHYIGMAAMRLRAMCLYSPGIVLLSIFLAIVISFVALQLSFAGRRETGSWSRRKIGSGLIMGAAIPIMHYVGMAAVTFSPAAEFNGSLAHAVPISSFGVSIIIAATIIILGHVYILSTVNRRFSSHARQLTDNEIQLATIFDNLMEGIVVLDKETKLVRTNAAADRILGLQPGSGLQPGLHSLTSIRNALEVRALDGVALAPDEWPSGRSLRGDFVQNEEYEIFSKHSGKTTIVEISSAPIVNASGETVQTIITYRDVTERKKTEEWRARMVAIIESSQDAIIGKDLNGIVTSWNKGAEKIFGYRGEEMIGQSIQHLLPIGHESEEDGILDRIRRGESLDQLETIRRRKDGQLVQVSLMISPIRDGKGRVIGASKIARDVTEKKLMERQLRQSQKMEAIGQLTGGIAHDFNNLLAIVIGKLGLMERLVEGNEAALQRLRPAQKAAARGADITRRLLALASKEDLNPVITRVESAVQETIELAGRVLGPEIKIVTHFDTSVPSVFVDASGLESALLNLCVNARDAMPQGGTLTFDTQLSELDASFPSVKTGELKAGSYVRISVSDTGHGMSRETLDRALEPFFTTKARNKGTGLGLAMVYGFARQSGGTIRLYSELDYGTTVSLYLPVATQEAAVAEPAPTTLPLVTGGTVLVVDDESDLLDIAHAYLTEMGYSALRANSAANALSILNEYREIDLMVTDIIMPGGMNGVELAEKARVLNPTLKVIYSSGFPADALVERNGAMVDGPMLRKPYHRAEFAAIVQRAFSGPTA